MRRDRVEGYRYPGYLRKISIERLKTLIRLDYSGLQLGWIHRGVGAGFEDNLSQKKQGSSLNPPLQNLYSTKSQTAIYSEGLGARG